MRVLGHILAVGLVLLLMAPPPGGAQSNLPPEAQAQLGIVKVDRALRAKDEATALQTLGELRAAKLPLPPDMLLLEAKLAGKAQDYARAIAAVEAYFKLAEPRDPAYREAAELLAAAQERKALADQQRAARERAAYIAQLWTEASAAQSCAGYARYLTAAGGAGEHAAAAQAAMGPCVLAAGAAPAPLASFWDCADCPEMVALPGGRFLMGSPASETGRSSDEGPQRRVTIAPFAVRKFEVTFAQYAAFAQESGLPLAGSCYVHSDKQPWSEQTGTNWQNPGIRQAADHPVVCVSWDDAQAYVAWLSRKTGQRYRLLTEAEWEYAARAGTTTRWSFGDSESQLGTYAWFTSNSGFRTQPVGGKAANPWGLYDMHGNVWEWVEDCYRDNLSGQTAAASTTGDCSRRVLRGGSWFINPQYLRSAYRVRDNPTNRDIYRGFRLARTIFTP